ncbi:beta-mannosidase [Kineococcus xinjiangensis]|uniref:beta-mannosidase n=1 Tax=Kineococcus xinjiangensis TaxID=512762 RepID=A0A2S6IDZ6_9ACTN|nr:glycoside hydrolase family 2 protein [Kineococcus xinjiangensis]PPK92444.1 beta-mannosidase [Kineococcus xinjiangensis]
MLIAEDLGGSWTLSVDPGGDTGAGAGLPPAARALAGTTVPATVPGSVHTDLLRDGRLPDPFLDRNELDVAWVGRTDWCYRRGVRWNGPRHERLDLVFEGLDTVARVEVAGNVVGRTRNMHRTHRFDVTELLVGGDAAELAVHLTSAYTEAEHWRAVLGPRPGAYSEPFNFVRKMACSFGWDWGPTLVTAGIWRPVRLEGWSTARIASVRPLAEHAAGDGHADGAGRLRIGVDVERAASGRDRDLRARVGVDGRVVGVLDLAAGTGTVQAELRVDSVAAWYPRGYGKQPLYDLEVELLDGAGRVLDTWRRRTGFRTVVLDTSADAAGSRFVLSVNGREVFAKGVNWIPEDVFPARTTREDCARLLGQAVDANVNLVRVWGGGLYESRDFYEVCDELGLMVWQDFLFACACYPEEEPIASEVVAEAVDNVTRLASHPSLVLWNGNNENLWLREPSGWTAMPGGDASWGERYYLDVLPRIVAELDPSRPYTAGSPWSGSWEHGPNHPDHQTFHSWDVWNRQDYGHYRDSTPRFVSEFGWQAPPAWTTLRRAVTDEPMLPTSPGVLHHQKAEDGNGKLERGLAPHFPPPATTEAWHYLTQLNQVRAVATGVGHWRASWPHTAGTVLWQLNDLWPVTSWSAIDGDGRFKPLYHALRELYADRTLTLQPRGDGLVVAVVNDTDAVWEARVDLARHRTDGGVLARRTLTVSVPPRAVGTADVPAELAVPASPQREFLVATAGNGGRSWWFAAPDGELELPDPRLRVRAEAVPGGLDVHLSAAAPAREVLVQADRIHPAAWASEGFLSLLPGETAVVRVRCPEALDPAAVTAPWVVTHLQGVLALSGGRRGADGGEVAGPAVRGTPLLRRSEGPGSTSNAL